MKAIMSTDSRHVHNTPAYACLHPSVCTGNSHKIRMHNAHSKYTHTYTTHAGQMFTLPMQKVIFSGFYLWGNQIPGSRSPRATSRMYSRLRTSQGHESPTHSPGDEHQQGSPGWTAAPQPGPLLLPGNLSAPSWLSLLQFREEPKPGDLIEISRIGYSHWAIYVGDGYVIHLAPPGKDYESIISKDMSHNENNSKVSAIMGNPSWFVPDQCWRT